MMILITKLDSLARSVRRYNLRVIERIDDDGAFRVYEMARKGSGTRGGRYIKNYRRVVLSPAADCEAHRLGLLKSG